MYGCGLRSSEALDLKIKSINFDTNQLTISNPKYFRVLSIPTKIISHLNCQIELVKKQFKKDVKSKYFHRIRQNKCYLFPMKQLCNNIDGLLIRLPIISNTLNYNLSLAAKKTKNNR
ncbi:hypothetical protein [Isorropodon fossajaponicum symbiont]|uniref:hypothetical protein n=1 Tax=Isorropodon fossajaponicum symbiont TaxID=883811 RepID=UPI00191627DC|nr:hypothetical protein [Isorropodon fossajaponicum symbiont]